MTLIRIFIEGPDVSLKGITDVSPTTVAACVSVPLPPRLPFFDKLLGVVPGAAGIRHHQRHQDTAQ